MRELPQPPGEPDSRSADRYLLWLVGKEWRSLTWSWILSGSYSLFPVLSTAALGAALDSGVTHGDTRALLLWSGVLAACAVGTAVLVAPTHRAMAFNWYASGYRTVQAVTARAADLGPTLTRRLPSGEVVAVGTEDIDRIGDLYEETVLVPGALVSVGAIAVLTLNSHPTFGIIVLVGVPLIMFAMSPMLRPLSRRQTHQRTRQAELTTRATDLVTGLRVLRGVGGERAVGGRYREESRRVRDAGVRVGWIDAALQAVQALYPGLLLALIVWYGARLALAGEITIGQLVAFYGYTGLLGVSVRHLMHSVTLYIGARVAAARAVRVLRLHHDHPEPEHPAIAPEGTCDLRDGTTGATVAAGLTTGIVCPDPAEATALVERLGRYRQEAAALVEHGTGRSVPLGDLPLHEVRRRILVAANDAVLFSGRLRDELSPDGGLSEERLSAVVRAAHADDIVEQSYGGLESTVAERGREYSGGQQQRLRLARALAADPEILVLVEPASAVDAHSEALIAERLAGERAGRTTALVTTSPLLLRHTDRVCLVEDGRLVAEGTHRQLIDTEPRYTRSVLRDVESHDTDQQ